MVIKYTVRRSVRKRIGVHWKTRKEINHVPPKHPGTSTPPQISHIPVQNGSLVSPPWDLLRSSHGSWRTTNHDRVVSG